MPDFFHFLLQALHRSYFRLFGKAKQTKCNIPTDREGAAEMIYNLLSGDKPCMIARYGSTELAAIQNYIGVKSTKHSVLSFIRGKRHEWWWNENVMEQMKRWSGFFPSTPEYLARFGELMLADAAEVDLLGSWLAAEDELQPYMRPDVQKVHLLLLEPFWSRKPWSRILRGKRVLVIHPFEETIRQQYERRELLFANADTLPKFSLLTIKAVQSLGGEADGFASWFDALDHMKAQMDSVEYDIALIGCGAYGFPLAAHAKRTGHKAVHLGGALQLLFGIKGKRWENPQHGAERLGKEGPYLDLFNEHWVYPADTDRPATAANVEGACYWGK